MAVGRPTDPQDIMAAAKKRAPLQVVYRPVEALIPYARNSRVHSDAQVAQIAASIREFGFTNPVLLDAEDGIIAGHGRVLAARKLSMDEVPCIVLAHLSRPQRRALLLADNRLALTAGWDDDMLRLELGELKEVNFDLALTGFDQTEIHNLFDGWDPNQDKIDKTPAEMTDLRHTIKVTCRPEHAEAIEAILQKAISLSDYPDVEIA